MQRDQSGGVHTPIALHCGYLFAFIFQYGGHNNSKRKILVENLVKVGRSFVLSP